MTFSLMHLHLVKFKYRLFSFLIMISEPIIVNGKQVKINVEKSGLLMACYEGQEPGKLTPFDYEILLTDLLIVDTFKSEEKIANTDFSERESQIDDYLNVMRRGLEILTDIEESNQIIPLRRSLQHKREEFIVEQYPEMAEIYHEENLNHNMRRFGLAYLLIVSCFESLGVDPLAYDEITIPSSKEVQQIANGNFNHLSKEHYETPNRVTPIPSVVWNKPSSQKSNKILKDWLNERLPSYPNN
jgi:hypothetical protein